VPHVRTEYVSAQQDVCFIVWSRLCVAVGLDCKLHDCPVTCVHGGCDYSMGTCRCEEGWSGPTCDDKDNCYFNCSGHGECTQGMCLCHPKYFGHDCSVTHCSADGTTMYDEATGSINFAFSGTQVSTVNCRMFIWPKQVNMHKLVSTITLTIDILDIPTKGWVKFYQYNPVTNEVKNLLTVNGRLDRKEIVTAAGVMIIKMGSDSQYTSWFGYPGIASSYTSSGSTTPSPLALEMNPKWVVAPPLKNSASFPVIEMQAPGLCTIDDSTHDGLTVSIGGYATDPVSTGM